MFRSQREERPRRHSRSPVRRERVEERSRGYERSSRRSRSRSRSRDRVPSRRDRSRSRERAYEHSYRDREAEYDQYAAFGGYGYTGYGMYPAAPYGVPVPGLLGDSCFVCGGIGHIALDCPSRETLQRGRAAVVAPRVSREREVEKCFECGKQGHQARECPFAKTVRENGAPVPRCYTCNAVGHIARDCPQTDPPSRKRSPPPRRSERVSDDESNRPHRRERSPRRDRTPERSYKSSLPPPPPLRPERGDLGCFICHEAGHFARDCPERGGPRDPRADDYLRTRDYGLGVGPGMVGPALSVASYRAPVAAVMPKPRRGEAVCYECGRLGHFGRECPVRLASQSKRVERRDHRDERGDRDRGDRERGDRERGERRYDEDRKEAALNNDLEDYMKAKPAKDRDYTDGAYRSERDGSEGREREPSVGASREGSSDRKRDGSLEPRGER